MIDFIDIKILTNTLERELARTYGEDGPYMASVSEENLKKFRLIMNLIMQQPNKEAK